MGEIGMTSASWMENGPVVSTALEEPETLRFPVEVLIGVPGVDGTVGVVAAGWDEPDNLCC